MNTQIHVIASFRQGEARDLKQGFASFHFSLACCDSQLRIEKDPSFGTQIFGDEVASRRHTEINMHCIKQCSWLVLLQPWSDVNLASVCSASPKHEPDLEDSTVVV